VLFSVIERLPPWQKWGHRGRTTGSAECPHRTRLPGFIKNGEMLGMVHRRARGWWPVRPNVIFDQMAAPSPEIMDRRASSCHGHLTSSAQNDL
jgi:hypothetical protein